VRASGGHLDSCTEGIIGFRQRDQLPQPLRDPVLVAAFEGWNDAGDAASTAAAFLRRRLGARRFAALDPEEFYDFQVSRPHVRLVEGNTRELRWPANDFFHARIERAAGARDVLLLHGVEPNLRWRAFSDLVVDVAREAGVRLVVTLGALLANVAHTRPVQVTGTAARPELAQRLGLGLSRYEGPTGIVGVLSDACRAAGFDAVSLWAAVPHYVRETPDPRATLALVRRVALLLDLDIDTAQLESSAVTYEQQVTQAIAGEPELVGYVEELEAEADAPDEEPEPSGEAIAAELEAFLREQTKPPEE
jgi:proteasome assembly chaperone (PAC2) family protein